MIDFYHANSRSFWRCSGVTVVACVFLFSCVVPSTSRANRSLSEEIETPQDVSRVGESALRKRLTQKRLTLALPLCRLVDGRKQRLQRALQPTHLHCFTGHRWHNGYMAPLRC